ncbi:lengsin [Gadus macrocephalus]|uniref:lengsin n=1 Tax=Gadus macrocephalus TaxID=80720 RepID=UPI0028CB2368|nr:lengsin [Gadus macrocephalus]XP_059903067.1 lengsin [Gadus macrocephalus]
MSSSEELLQMKAQQGVSRDTVDGVGVSLGRRKGVTLSEEQASSEEGDSRERLSIVHTDADRGPSPATTTLVSIGSPPPRPRSRGGPDRGGSGPPWTRGGLYHGGPCRPSDIPRQTMEELKTTLREGPHLAFRVQGDARSREPSTPLLKGQNAVQGGGGASDQGHRRVLTTFKPHEGGASIRGPGPGDPRAGQHPSSLFRPDAFPYRSPGGRYPPPGGWDPSDEAGRSQTDSREPCAGGSGCSSSSDMENIKQQMTRENIRFVRFEAVDLHGVSRSKTVPARHFHEKAAFGVPMPRSYLELTLSPSSEVDNADAANFNSDILLMPDLHTFRVLPWAEQTARVICDPCTVTGAPLRTSPRLIAKQLLGQLQSLGFSLHSSFTYECCVLGAADRPGPKTLMFPATTLLSNHQLPFFQQLVDSMYCMGCDVDSFASASGPGQMEVNLRPEFGIAAADSAFTFRTSLKEMARKHGYLASFFTDDSLHNAGVLSHSLWDASGRRGLFHSGEARGGELSEMGKKWLAGLLSHSAALSCLLSPGRDCRSRTARRAKEPQRGMHATCGYNDHSSSFNVKRHGGRTLHIDNQLGSAAANPYVVLAATVAAGLDGIKRSLSLEAGPGQQRQHAIPVRLEDALEALEADHMLGSALGEPFVQYFIAMKKFEIETQELDDERNKCLEYFI